MTQTHTPTPYKADGWDICQDNNNHFHVIASVRLWTDFSAADFENKKITTYGKQWLVDMQCPIDGTEEANAAFICKAANNHESLLAACKAQHTAIDILLAALIERDNTFLPSKSIVWPMLLQGNAAIATAEAL